MKYLNDVNYKDCVGKICKSKSSGDFKIVKYNDSRNVEIQLSTQVIKRLQHLVTSETVMLKTHMCHQFVVLG